MDGPYDIEIESEVAAWLDGLPVDQFLKVDLKVGELAEQPLTLGEPHAKHLGEGVRELRFTLGMAHIRLTYWLTDRRSMVLLTQFAKTQRRERAEEQLRAQRPYKLMSDFAQVLAAPPREQLGRSKLTGPQIYGRRAGVEVQVLGPNVAMDDRLRQLLTLEAADLPIEPAPRRLGEQVLDGLEVLPCVRRDRRTDLGRYGPEPGGGR